MPWVIRGSSNGGRTCERWPPSSAPGAGEPGPQRGDHRVQALVVEVQVVGVLAQLALRALGRVGELADERQVRFARAVDDGALELGQPRVSRGTLTSRSMDIGDSG